MADLQGLTGICGGEQMFLFAAKAPGEAVKHRSKRLLDHVRGAICLKGYSVRTEEAYGDWIKRFILFHDKRYPREMGYSGI
ncbi:MAG: phage integrase N-terminal SAM-like domain-containing protein, partial [Chloroflexota bacterium]|nr:phage integrase N-terminal SAM-like domain-containing protein [Chloroflexota bacterium]